MTEQEARQILGVTEETPWEEIVKVSLSSVFSCLPICYMNDILIILPCRNMTACLKAIRRVEVSTFSQKFIGPRNV